MSDEEKAEKTASQLLVEMSARQEEILKYCQIIHLNFQTILNELKGLKGANLSSIIEKKGGTVITDQSPPAIAKQQKKPAPPPKERGEVMRKFAIQQKILYPNGRPAAQAKFSIKDFNSSEGKVLVSGKTNLQGKWMANLAPGIYSVEVEKYALEDKPAINLSYQIEVDGSGPTELPDQKVEG